MSMAKAVHDIVWWMTVHNLVRHASFEGAFVGPMRDSDAELLLNYDGTALKYLFDADFGGGSKHLLKDFDEEVLAPLHLRMKVVGPHTIGLFKIRKTKGKR